MMISRSVPGAVLLLALAACKPAAAPDAATPADAAPTPAAADRVDPAPATPAPAATRMRAFGNEPFWSMVDEGGGALRFTTPDNPDGDRFSARRSEDAAGIHYAGAGLALDIVAKDCSDGMSDLVHPFAATMTLNGVAYQGCAARADAPPAGEVAAPAADSEVTRFSANGFSPAWRVEVAGGTLRLDVPEHARVEPGFTEVAVRRSTFPKGIEFAGRDAGIDVVLTLDGRARCDLAGDAAGRTGREFLATLQYGARTYRGCADVAR